MPQRIIDRRNVEDAVDDRRIAIIPPPLRNFGYVPNFGLCKPGDLVLSHGIAPNWIGRSISDAQRRAGFAADDNRWTHAAVFLYENLVVEAVPRYGVRLHNLYDDVMQNVIRIRRPRLDTELQRANVALRAVAALGVGYSWIAALRLGWRMNSGLWNPGGLITYGRRIICSKVFFDAHLEIAPPPRVPA